MKDTLIILSSAYSPAPSPHRHTYTGEERVLQFLNGYNSFFNNFHGDLLKKYKWIIHFEPRTVLSSFDFFNYFYSNKKNLFALDNTGQQFYTGLFSISSELLLDFADLDLDQMVQQSISLEKVFHDYMRDKPKEMVESAGVLWFDKCSQSSYYF